MNGSTVVLVPCFLKRPRCGAADSAWEPSSLSCPELSSCLTFQDVAGYFAWDCGSSGHCREVYVACIAYYTLHMSLGDMVSFVLIFTS